MKFIRKDREIVSLENVERVALIDADYKRTRAGEEIIVVEWKIMIEYTDKATRFIKTDLEGDAAFETMSRCFDRIEKILLEG